MTYASQISRRAFEDYRAFYYARNIHQAKSARATCALSYAMYPKEDQIDYESLCACVALNIQRDILGLPYQDPKYKHYCKTVANLLSTSTDLDHVIYSLMYWHSVGDRQAFHSTLQRCVDIIEIYQPAPEAKTSLKNFMAVARRVAKSLGQNSELDPNQKDFMKSLYQISINFFRLEI